MTLIGPSGAEEVVVPALLGMSVSAARQVAGDAGLVIASADPDGPPLDALTCPGVWIVTAQRPVPGSVLRRNGSVVVDVRQGPLGEEAGDR
jgi:hypothetical protein